MSKESKELQVEKQEVQAVEGVERTRAGHVFLPKVDIYTMDEDIVILAEMPGIDEQDLDITLEKNILTIKGFVTFDPPAGYEMACREYVVGDYERSFNLPDDIDRNKIEATVKDGVLRLLLQKAP
jgi:HSP20 family molecular chaperone IbpA